MIDFDMAMAAILELRKHNNLEYVVLLGGEPGLFPELTHELAAAIRQYALGLRVETNASWATGEKAATSFLEPLCAVDAEIMISVDSFHEPFVSLACVERAICTLDKLGGKYVLEAPYVDHPAGAHPADIRTNELLVELEHRLARKPCAPVYKGPVYFKGRAAHTLAPEIASGRTVPDEVCDTVPWWTNGSQRTLDLLGLDPDGYLSKECGIAIGNVRGQGIKELVETFDAETHHILSILVRRGPLGLAREASELGYVLKSSYADRCRLCQEAREALRPEYPSCLALGIHYRELGNPAM